MSPWIIALLLIIGLAILGFIGYMIYVYYKTKNAVPLDGMPGHTCTQTKDCAEGLSCTDGKCTGLCDKCCVEDNNFPQSTCPIGYVCLGDKCLAGFVTFCETNADCVTADCSNNTCDVAAPLQVCVTSAECPSGSICFGGNCRAATGSACSSNTQCLSNICKNSVCAETL